MHRIILRLSVALLTFALGVAVSAIFWMNAVRCISGPSLPKDEVLLMPVTSCYPGRSIAIPATVGTSYFPTKIFSPDEWSDRFRVDWYSSHLRAMHEAPLYSSDDTRLESYRFLWLPSFQHPVAVSLWSSGSERFISVKKLSGQGGYEPGRLTLSNIRKLDEAEWSEFIRRLDDACYWQLPTVEENYGLDGARWILEGVKEGRYHVVDRWSPTGGSYHELCLYVLELSGL